MGNIKGERISLNRLCELIDLYKRASIDGDRVDFIVYPENNKRIIKIKLQQGYSIQESTYVFEDGQLFDDSIYSRLLNVFLLDDSFGGWKLIEQENEPYKGVLETHSGNVIYLDTYNKDLFDKVPEKGIINKGKLTTEDKVWDEIICYANNRKILSRLSLSDEEVDTVYDYISNHGILDNKVRYGNTNSARINNENYLIELLGNRDTLISEGFPEEIANKINASLIKQLAILLGNEKRIRYRLDIDDENISGRIKFAIFELDSVGYFDLKNKLTKEMPTIKCKMSVVSRLLSQLNHGSLYTEELNNQYKEYCYEIIGYLYRKGSTIDISEDDSILFDEYKSNDEKETSELTSQEIEEIISFVEESKAKDVKKDKDLFTVVKKQKEEKETDTALEIEDAYEKSLDYSTLASPSWIKVLFEKENDDEADVIISNKSGGQDLVLYRRSIDIDKLENEVMDTLRKLFSKNNSIHYNIKYKLDDTDNSCLLMVGDKRTTFTIINGPEDFIDDNKKKIEELMNINS